MINNEIKYKTIQPPYTLDKWKDGSAQIRTEKEFQELVNYIPVEGGIVAREGILTLTYTPQQTHEITYPFPESGGWTPTYPAITTACRCQMVLKFEGNALLGYNSMLYATGPNPHFTAMTCPNYVDNETGITGQGTCGNAFAVSKQGTYSLLIDSAPITNPYASSPAQSYGMSSRFNNPPSWLYTGTGVQTCVLYTYWLWPYYNNANEDGHLYVEVAGAYAYGMRFRHFDDTFQVYWRNSGAITFESNVNAGISSPKQWYFCAGWIDFPNQRYGIYLYDDVLKTETYCANDTGAMNVGHHLYNAISSSLLTIGGGRNFDAVGNGYILDVSQAMRGQIDYVTMWDIIPSDASTSIITLVRAIRDLHKAP